MQNFIELGGLTFYGAASSGFVFTDLTGWHSLTQSKSVVEEKPLAHGAFDLGPDYRQSAAISFKGWYLGSSHADALQKARVLSAWGQSNSVQTMRVWDDLGSLSRQVSIRFVTIEDTKGRPELQFQVDILAPDPLKYDMTMNLSTGLPSPGGGLRWPLVWPLRFGSGGVNGRVTVYNVGTADSRNVMTISGGGSSGGFQLAAVGTDQKLTLAREIPDGSTVTFNARTGRVYINGSDITRFLTDDDWFVAPANGTLKVQFLAIGTVTGTPILTIKHQAAYW